MKFFLFVVVILNIFQPKLSAGGPHISQQKQIPQGPPCVLEERPPAYNPEYMALQASSGIQDCSKKIPPADKRRSLVWCICTKCKDVVPILLKGNTTQTASFGKHKHPNGEPKYPFSKRTKKCNRPTVQIELRQHKSPCNIVRKILMTTF